MTRNIPGDSTPIVVGADDVATWVENKQRIVLARGKVLVQEGVVQIRANQAVAFVDLKGGILHMDVYAEGDVQIDNSTAVRSAPRAFASLSTRGEFKLRAYKNKVVQQPQAGNPLVQRGRAECAASVAARRGRSKDKRLRRRELAGAAQSTGGKAGGGASGGLLRAPSRAAAGGTQPAPPSLKPRHRVSVGAAPAGADAVAAAVATWRQAASTAAGAAPIQHRAARAQGSTSKENHSPTANKPSSSPAASLLRSPTSPGVGLLDIEADRLVVWNKGRDSQQLITALQNSKGQSTNQLEFYLSGNVEIRETDGPNLRILRADEAYYDVNHNVAVALSATIQLKQTGLPDEIYIKADELLELAPKKYQVIRSELFSSKLPSDPGLKVYFADAVIEDKTSPKFSIFGMPVFDRKTGKQVQQPQTLVEAHNVYFELQNVPFFYLPYVAGDAREPFGPITSFSAGYNTIFGLQFGVGLDLYELLGIEPIEGTHWRGDINYLSRRRPSVDSEFDFTGKELFGIQARYTGVIKGTAMYDRAYDILGGSREIYPGAFVPVDFRGRFLYREDIHDLPYGFTVQTQVSALSDHNFLEQYYKQEFDRELNQSTFVYVKEQPERENWAVTGLVEPRIRDWVTETEQLPSVNGRLIGESFLDHFTYNAWAGAGYYDLLNSSDVTRSNAIEKPVSPTDQNDGTGRFFLQQEFSAPFTSAP